MGLKLLVVDDAPFIQEIVRHLIERSDIELVGEAYDGHEAVQVALATKPDVILMDVVLPVRNGLDAAKEILKKMPNVRIIACSTVQNETLTLRAIEAGCCDFVLKPFTAQQLLKALRDAFLLGDKQNAKITHL